MVVHAYYLRDARVRRYAEALVESGYEVDVFCLRDSGEPARQEHYGVRIIRLPLTRKRGGKLSYCLEYLLSIFLFMVYVTLFHLRRHYRLLHIHTSPDVLVFTAWLPKLTGAKIVLDFHDPMPELYMSKFKLGSNHPAVRLIKELERVSASFADLIITASASFRRIFLRRGFCAEILHVINNVADPRIFQPRAEQRAGARRFVMLYVGTISERYGVDVPIRALPVLRKLIPGILLRVRGKISGEGNDLVQLMNLAAQLEVADLVEFLDPVPLEKVPVDMAEADVGIYTPIHDVHMDHALSLKVPEFAAIGLPIVATRTPVMEEYLGPEGAAYIESGDVSAFVEQVLKLYRDPEFRDTLIRRSRDSLNNYSWDGERRQYLQLVASLTGVADQETARHAPFRSGVKRMCRVLVTRTAECARVLKGSGATNPVACLRILTYHNIEPDPQNDFSVSLRAFADQMAFLKEHYPVVSLGTAAAWMDGRAQIGGTAIAITFDDGFRDIIEYALPALLKHDLVATVFLIEHAMKDGGAWMGRPALSPANIRAMAAAGIEFGSHSRSHISLASAHLAPAVLEREIGGSKTGLEKSLGVPIPYFAYPYGTARDIDDRVVQAVRQAGYRLGCTSIHGRNLASTHPLLLRRVKVERFDSRATFRELLRGGMDAWAAVDNYGSFLQSKRRTQPFAGADAESSAR